MGKAIGNMLLREVPDQLPTRMAANIHQRLWCVLVTTVDAVIE
jgi:hypothetical protein